jgi:long-chain acyl-CoA synthetase
MSTAGSIDDELLPLGCLYLWEIERADKIFLTQPYDGGKLREWTWAEAAAEVRRIAAWLEAQHWEPGARIAILSKNCAWWIMADLAIWMSGHVSVPIYPSLKSQSVRQILEHCGAKCCFLGATDEKETACFGIPPGMPCISFPTATAGDHRPWDDVIATTLPMTGTPTRAADDLATIIYTSGTTGLPKGVMHRFSAWRFTAHSCIRRLGLDTDEQLLSYLPLAHIVERIGAEIISLALGSRLFFTEGIDTFLADLKRARCTVFLSVPRLLLKFQQGVFAKMPRERLDLLLHIPILGSIVKKRVLVQLGLDTARYAACGAAPLQPDLLLWYRKLGLNLAEGYGMTETLITHLPMAGTVRPGFVGAAIPGVECRLGENSELLVRSPMNMMGYYQDPQSTRDTFTEDGFFRTGDVCHIAPDGQLRIVGRVKEQFKTSKGKYVAPAPIESKLLAHPALEACCLMGAGHPSPFAIVLLSMEAREQCANADGQKRLAESLHLQMRTVNADLDPHERVAFLVVVDGPWTIGNGLITPTLKIKRTALEGRYQELFEDWQRQDVPVVWERPS